MLETVKASARLRNNRAIAPDTSVLHLKGPMFSG